MNKKILIACVSAISATTSLVACAQTKNQINLTPEDSRNLRIASSLGTLNHMEETRKEKAFNTEISLGSELENILYSVEVLLVNDFNIKTTNQAEGDFYKFDIHYTNQETISFMSSKEQEVSLNIYFNEIKDNDVKYEENIEGIVTYYYKSDLVVTAEKEVKLVDFTSTSLEKNAEKGKYLERKLTLYHKDYEGTQFEASEFKSEDVHQFYYEYRVLDKKIISYSIDLNQEDDVSMMFSLLGYRLKFIRIVEDNQTSFKVGVVNGDEFVQILRFSKTVTEDGTVTYHVEIEI